MIHFCPLDRPEIDRIWSHAAAALGFRVERSSASYASTNGSRVIEIGTRETLDDDDSFAQLVFHELCHALVQGEANLERADWGLDNTTHDDVDQEYACLRVQAHLSDGAGLRPEMTPTTDVRKYYLALPEDALAGTDAATSIARAAIARPLFERWRPVLDRALAQTAAAVRSRGDVSTGG